MCTPGPFWDDPLSTLGGYGILYHRSVIASRERKTFRDLPEYLTLVFVLWIYPPGHHQPQTNIISLRPPRPCGNIDHRGGPHEPALESQGEVSSPGYGGREDQVDGGWEGGGGPRFFGGGVEQGSFGAPGGGGGDAG